MAKSRLEIILSLNDKASKGLGSVTNKLQKVGKVAAGVALGGVVALGAGVAGLVANTIPAASDLSEAANAVNVVFGDAADQVLDWGDKAVTQAGLASSAFFQMSAQTGAMLQNLGFDFQYRRRSGSRSHPGRSARGDRPA